MNNTLYIAKSNHIKRSEKKSFFSQFGETKFVLATPNTSFRKTLTRESLKTVKRIALQIVAEAIASNATHFYCALPDFRLNVWANLYASGLTYRGQGDNYVSSLIPLENENGSYTKQLYVPMVCVQPSDVVGSRWANMF